MTAVTIEKAQNNLYEIASEVYESSVPITVVNDKGKNFVILSEDDWNSLQETLYLYSIPGMVESIIEARKEPLSECKEYDPDNKNF